MDKKDLEKLYEGVDITKFEIPKSKLPVILWLLVSVLAGLCGGLLAYLYTTL